MKEEKCLVLGDTLVTALGLEEELEYPAVAQSKDN